GHTARGVLRFAPQHPGGPEIEVVGHSLGFVRLFARPDYDGVVGHLGPDILAPDWASTPPDGHSGRDEALRRILARPERSIGAALLDQRNVAGIGNEYRAEVCFLGGVDPRRPVGTGEDATTTAAHLLDLSRRVMAETRLEPRPRLTGARPPGMGNSVFGRAEKACRRCGSPILKGFLGGVDADGDEGELERVIWWCPVCQAE
ncbi:MAG: Fpg/Nei family DNA glycosylase, partial [Corynebacterium variabile]|nr:Fpg/Nei family DNA glycosylase [Corynebacterium variabile]